MTIEEYMEDYAERFELVLMGVGLWSVHDKEEHSYTWGMMWDEALQYLRRRGVDIRKVKIMN